jgi:hypothetical protein
MPKKATATETAADTLVLTPEEVAAIKQIRSGTPSTEPAPVPTDGQVGLSELANALVAAIRATQPPSKKTIANRKKGSPWEPKDGKVKPKLRRMMYHHGLELNPDILSSEEIELLNKIKPGSFCNGYVRVIKRKDRSIDVDYPVRTASQRLRLVNEFGVRSFAELLQRLIDEAANPAVYKAPEDDD